MHQPPLWNRSLPGLVLCWLLGGILGASTATPGCSARVRIDMRGPIRAGWFDPATETVGLRGGTPPLSWERTLPAAPTGKAGIYQAVVDFPLEPGQAVSVSYKFKVDGAGNPDDGWEAGSNRALLLPKAKNTTARAFDAPGPAYPRTLTGTLRRHPDFPSRFVTPRDVTVLLPPGYRSQPRRRYAVLYMHDGQNLFDAAAGSGNEWRMDETSRELLRRREIEQLLIVGIASIPAERIADYTPAPQMQERDGQSIRLGGNAEAYGRFLVEELKPFIDRSYRTLSDPASTGLGGSSLGGLVTVYLGLKYPDIFSKLIVASPAAFWADYQILSEVEQIRRKPRLWIWLDAGTAEGDSMIPGARRLRDALLAKGWVEGADLRYLEAEGAQHDESAWAARVAPMLRFLFPPAAPPGAKH